MGDPSLTDVTVEDFPRLDPTRLRWKSFNPRVWENVGIPMQETREAWTEMDRLAPPQSHVGLASSEKLRIMGQEPALAESVRVAQAHMAQFLPAEPEPEDDAVQLRPTQPAWQPQKRTHVVERGSALRFLRDSKKGIRSDQERLMEDPLERVAGGLAKLRARSSTSVANKRPKPALARAASATELVPQATLKLTESGQFQSVQRATQRSRPVPAKLQSAEAFELDSCADSCPVFSHLAESRTPASRAQRRMESRGRFVQLDDLEKFCCDIFGGLEQAWFAIDEHRVGSVTESQFLGALAGKNYPSGQLGAKLIFFYIDTDDDKLISFEDIRRAFDEAALAKSQASLMKSTKAKLRFSLALDPVTSEEPDPTDAMDVFESTHTFADYSGGLSVRPPANIDEAEILDARERIARHLTMKEPVVGEFIWYLFRTFRTIRVAFRQWDVNRNGFITLAEFKEGMKRPNFKKGHAGKSIVEVHVDGLWNRICVRGGSKISIGDLHRVVWEGSASGEPQHPFLVRLGQFLQGAAEAVKISGEALRRKWFERAFAPHGTPAVGYGEFAFALSSLRYGDWHSSDLFSKLDKDASGSLTVGEFTAMLEKEPLIGRQPYKPVRPLGSEKRQQQVEMLQPSLATSPKMSLRRPCLGDFRHNSKLPRDYAARECLPDQQDDRMDSMGSKSGQSSQTRSGSELRNKGSVTFASPTNGARDLTEIGSEGASIVDIEIGGRAIL